MVQNTCVLLINSILTQIVYISNNYVWNLVGSITMINLFEDAKLDDYMNFMFLLSVKRYEKLTHPE